MNYGTLRFSQIQKLKPGLSPRILTAQLRELEKDGLILRNVYPIVPSKVEYTLSPIGESLRPLVRSMKEWGDFYIQANLHAHAVEANAATGETSTC
jgi:DNA-binding HxlR family transcriptional regulator